MHHTVGLVVQRARGHVKIPSLGFPFDPKAYFSTTGVAVGMRSETPVKGKRALPRNKTSSRPALELFPHCKGFSWGRAPPNRSTPEDGDMRDIAVIPLQNEILGNSQQKSSRGPHEWGAESTHPKTAEGLENQPDSR